MSTGKRNRAWPLAIALSAAVVGVLAAFIVLAVQQPAPTSADGPAICHTPFAGINPECAAGHPHDDGTTPTTPTEPTEPTTPTEPTAGDVDIDGFSSSSNGSDDVTIKVNDAGMPYLNIDDSIILVLHKDFTVPDSIANGVVYIRDRGGNSGGARLYSSVSVDSEDDSGDETDAYYVGDDSHTIQIYIPDTDPADDTAAGLMGRSFEIVIPKRAGIKNPGDAKSFAIGYQIARGGGFQSDMTQMFDNDGSGDDKMDSKITTQPKVSLDDENNKRGYELTITGSGFNKGSSATAYVLKDRRTTEPTCEMVIDSGDKESLGSGTVGSDYKVAIVAEVTGGGKGDFSPGETNYICIRDDNSPTRRVSASPKAFELQHSIAVEPDSVASGEEVTVKLRDYQGNYMVANVSLDGKKDSEDGDFAITPNKGGTNPTELTFLMPGGVSGDVEVAVVVARPAGDDSKAPGNKDATITVNPSSLKLSQTAVAPNASIIISGSGFSENSYILVKKITLDDEEMVVDNAGTEGGYDDPDTDDVVENNLRAVKTTSSGTFTATVRVWSKAATNPALDDDDYTIKAVDASGYEGKATITVNEPTITVTPETASPRDFIVIRGENWPIGTADDDHDVVIEVDGRMRNAPIDGSGRFSYEYQLKSTIPIGDEQDVVVRFTGTGGDIEEETTFNVEEAELGIMPDAAAPGETISIDIKGMPPYTLVDAVRIDGRDRLGGRNINTNREGDAVVADILIPFLDPGFYPVEVIVGNETRVAQLEVLAEAGITGVATVLPDAVSDLGDNLDAIFHFNNQNKAWTFYDPRPEFAELNTLTELSGGQPYWVLVKESQEDVDWNGSLVNFTCAADDCWNLAIW